MTVANLYKKIKQLLEDSNTALVNRGLNKVNNLKNISFEIKKLGEINRLPYFLKGDVIMLTESDLQGINIIDDSFNLEKYSALTSVTIPDSVTDIGNYAFYRCASLIDIYLHSITPPSLHNITSISYTITIHVPIGSGDAYKAATNWSYHANRIVEDIEI